MTFYVEGSPRTAAQAVLEDLRRRGVLPEPPIEHARRLLQEAEGISELAQKMVEMMQVIEKEICDLGASCARRSTENTD